MYLIGEVFFWPARQRLYYGQFVVAANFRLLLHCFSLKTATIRAVVSLDFARTLRDHHVGTESSAAIQK